MPYAKALVPLVVTPILLVLELFGVTPDMTVEQAVSFVVSMILTSLLVYWVPNRK
jgi:hypothetical protein